MNKFWLIAIILFLIQSSCTKQIMLTNSSDTYIDLVQLGADPTGNKSSQQAIEQAIGLAKKTKQTIFLPAGRYKLTNTVEVNGILTMIGAGMHQCGIFLESEPNKYIFQFKKGSNGSKIGGFSIANRNGNGISHEYGIHSTIYEIKAGFGLSGIAFHATESIGIKYIDVHVGTNGQQFFRGSEKPEIGFDIESGVKFNSNQAVLERCYAAGCKLDGLRINGAQHIDTYSLYMVVNNSIFEGNERYGINILDAQGVRINNSHLEANKVDDLLLDQAHSFMWCGGIVNNCKILATAGATFISSTIGRLDIDKESYNCQFIGGSVQLGNMPVSIAGKYNDNVFLNVLRNNYAANGGGRAMFPNQNFYGAVLNKNGNFESWEEFPLKPKYYEVTKGVTVSRSEDAFIGRYSVRLTASGKEKFEGLTYDLSSMNEKVVPRTKHRVSISAWVKLLNERKPTSRSVSRVTQTPIILGAYNGYYNEWAKKSMIVERQDDWQHISYSLEYTPGMKVLIAFPEGSEADDEMLVDGLTVTLGNSIPSFYEDRDSADLPLRNEPPNSGFWQKGDRILNVDPRQGSFIGWVCVKSGTPGKWLGYGKIE